MKRSLFVFVVFWAGIAYAAETEPIELEIGLEVGAQKLFSDNLEMTVRPELALSLADTGFSIGLAWQALLFPDPGPGEVEFWQQYEILPARLEIVLWHSNIWIFADEKLEGRASLEAARYLWEIRAGMELEAKYAPNFGLTLIPRLLYGHELGPGMAGVGVDQYVNLHGGLALEETEFVVSYEIETRALTITAELLPTLTSDRQWILSAALTFSRTL